MNLDNRLGLGLGLRNTHFQYILNHWPNVDWFEAITENFIDSGGRPRYVLNQVAERYPVVLHGVSMSIGGTDPLDFDYLTKLRVLADEIQARWVSDHLCWTGVNGVNSHDLLPLPLTEPVLVHTVERILQVQDFLGRPLVLENPSTYLSFRLSCREESLDEPEFLSELCVRTGCKLLLDVNNVYVSCFNSASDPLAYLSNFPWQQVIQLHLAGHSHCGTHIIDTHDQPVCDAVWELFRIAWQRSGQAATLLEWDGDIPDFDRCLKELHRAYQYMEGQPDLGALTGEQSDREAVSTPVDFLLPNVMTELVVES